MGAEIDRLEVQVEAQATNANNQLDKLVDKLERLKNTLSGINAGGLSGLTDNMNGVKTTSVAVEKCSDSLNKLSKTMEYLSGKTQKSGKFLSTFSQIMGNVYTNSRLLISGVDNLWSGIETSMDYVETFNYWKVTLDKIGNEFGNLFNNYDYDNAETYVESFMDRLKALTAKMTGYEIGDVGDLVLLDVKNLGLDPEQLMNYQAKILAVTNSVGLMGETSINTAKALSMLSADLSSFTNEDLSTVMTNMQSGLIGQSRALYKYGIDITNATLQQYAYGEGLTKAVSVMTQAEKMQLRLLAILDQSQVAYGDQANTLNSVANQYRVLGQQVENLGRILGNLLLPVAKTLLPVINGLAISLKELFTALGFKVWGADWLKELQDGISGGFDNSGLEDIEDGADDVAGALDDATSAAKKLRNSLQGFDELNVINTQSDSNSGDVGGGTIDLSDAIAKALANYEAIWEKAFADAENKAQGFADIITGVFTDMWNAVEPFRTAISNLWDGGLSKLADFTWTSLKDFYDNFLVPLGEWAFGTEGAGLTRLVDVLNNGLMAIDWERLNTALSNFWTAIEPYAEQFGEGLIDFFEDILGIGVDAVNNLPDFLEGITDALNNGDPAKIRDWGYALGQLAVGILAFKGIASIIGTIANLGIALKTLHDGLSVFGGIFGKVGGAITTLITSIKTLSSGGLLESTGLFAKLANVIALVAGKAGTLSEAMTAIFGTVGATVAGITSTIGGALLAVTNFIDMLKNGFSWLGESLMVLGTALTAVGAVILGAPALVAGIVAAVVAAVGTIVVVVKDNWGAIREWFSGVAEWFNANVITPIVTFFEGLWTRVKQIFEGLWIIVQAVWIVASSWFDEKVTTPIVSFFEPIVEKVGSFFGNLWEDIKEMWSNVSSWFDTNVVQPLASIFDSLWEGVKSTMAGAMNAIIGGIESAINFIVGGINDILSGFNKVVSWAAKVAEVDWGGVDLIPTVTLPRIPAYSIGGFPEDGLFRANHHELVGKFSNGKTAVANNEQIITGIEQGVRDANAEQVALLREQNELLLAILEKETGKSDREIFDSMRRLADEYTNRTRKPAF